MRYEKTTSFSIHIMDGTEFLGRFAGPMLTTRNRWEFDPSDVFLSESQMDEIKQELKALNAKFCRRGEFNE